MSDYFGIDLGTSNCAVASAGDDGLPEVLPVTQVINATGIGEGQLLPSTVYIPAAGEISANSPRLPWEQEETRSFLGISEGSWSTGTRPPHCLGEKLAVPSPCRPARPDPSMGKHGGGKPSPLDVSRDLLAHILSSVRTNRPASSLEHVVATVPASFDEAARALTLEAATLAGLGEVTLLEEPQAAFYAWLENQGGEWRKQVKSGDLLLVCDVGGGTADFSLIAVTGNDGNLALERIAVGEHLLLGGDNIDLALSHAVSEKVAAAGTMLDDWQFLALVQAVRVAKEALLSNPGFRKLHLPSPRAAADSSRQPSAPT
jgi:molecular chaperone DnaK (HSP70)